MSLTSIRSRVPAEDHSRAEPSPPEPAHLFVEEDDDLAGAIESWFERGEEYDRRHGGADGRAS
jgi:hypothetical protein